MKPSCCSPRGDASIMRKLRSLTTTLRKAIRGVIVETCAPAAKGIKPVPSKVMNSRHFKCFPSGRGRIRYHAVARNAALCITAKQALMVAVGTRISPRPPRRSRRALLTHRAPPSGQTSCNKRFSYALARRHHSDRRGISAQCPNRGRLTAVPLG